MSETEDDLAEQLLNLFVYAPVGLALEAKELIPKLAERGKGQVALTRLAATVAAGKGQAEASKFASDLVSTLEDIFGVSDSDDEPDGSSDAQDSRKAPVDGYDDLTAPQVIAMVSDLSGAKRDAVEDYERANRNRVTVLKKIEQLRNT